MMNSVNWANPYVQREGEWLRGNLHAHTSPASGCSIIPLEDLLGGYRQAGYDFLAVSDHMKLTPAPDAGMIIIPGIEWNAPEGNRHTGVYALDPERVRPACVLTDQEVLLGAPDSADMLRILNHPNWELRPHYRREELAALRGYDGIEIYNAVIRRLSGYEIATDKWDYLLANDRRVLGFASDDAHRASDIGLGWMVARATARTPRAVLAALKTGNCYCSSGVTITDIYRDGDLIAVETADAQEIQAIGTGGRLLHTVPDRALAFSLDGLSETYVRFTCYGPGSAMAWTQPFFR
jgi:hypothetical protein